MAVRQGVQITVLLLFSSHLVMLTSASRLSGTTASLATFNPGLIPSTPEFENKARVLISMIRDSQLDVVCLQEVWRNDIQRQIYQGVRDLYPYYVSPLDLTQDPSGQASPACTPDVVEAYGACAFGCVASPADVDCPINQCLDILVPTTSECRSCLLLNLNDNNITACATEPEANYERSFGLMLFSRREIMGGQVAGLNPVADIRGYYQAMIADVGEVFCTHLSVSFRDSGLYVGPPIVSPYLYDNYEAQQLDELVTLLNSTSSLRDNTIFMGDFNHGPVLATPPGVSAIVPEFPLLYGLVNAYGYYSPYVLRDGRCTFCAENPDVTIPSRVIDHIYVAVTASDRVVYSERMWDDVFVAELPLSDHYGVKLVLRDLNSCCNDVWFNRQQHYLPPFVFPSQHLDNICSAVDSGGSGEA